MRATRFVELKQSRARLDIDKYHSRKPVGALAAWAIAIMAGEPFVCGVYCHRLRARIRFGHARRACSYSIASGMHKHLTYRCWAAGDKKKRLHAACLGRRYSPDVDVGRA